MGSKSLLAFAGAAAVLASVSAQAADFPPQPQPYPQQYALPPQPIYQQAHLEFSGWYLRGDIGVGAQRFQSFDFTQTNAAFVWPASWRIDQKDIKDSTFFALGIGYSINGWLRFDATGEYRGSTKFKALGSYTEFCPGGARCFDLYDGDHQASVFLANAYLDLGTWWCLTPFVGVGVGGARHTFDGFTDIGFIADGSTGFGFASASKTMWTFAWQAQVGLAYDISKTAKIELAYRYLDLGSPQSSIINCSSTSCMGSGPRAFYTLTNMTASELKLGVRWMLDIPEPAPVFAPPLVRKG